MTQHAPTPGPWKAHFGWEMEGLKAPSEEYPNYCEITTTAEGHHLSMSGHCGIDNARLMAAAPELLEALRISKPWLKRLKKYHLIPSSALAEDLKYLDAAIAKATGAA